MVAECGCHSSEGVTWLHIFWRSLTGSTRHRAISGLHFTAHCVIYGTALLHSWRWRSQQQRMEADDPIESVGVVDEARPPEEFDDDAWIAEEIDRQAREQETNDGQGEGERYIAQLMDTLELRSLHTALRRTEAQLATEGRLREYTPRQLAAPEPAQVPTTRHGCIWGGRDRSNDTNESNQSAHQEGDETEEAAPETGSAMTRAELAQILRAECYQVRGELSMCCENCRAEGF